jgi:hypothetical protein
MITIEEIRSKVNGHCLVTSNDIAVLPRGHVRIGTKLLYPDGSGIDLFVEMGDRQRAHDYTVSDFGRTFSKLAEYQMNVRSPLTRQKIIADMAKPFKVEVVGDRLTVILVSPDDLSDGLIRLGQACISVSGLIFTRHAARQTSLTEEVKSVIENAELDFEIKYPHVGPYDKPIQVDYRVTGPSRTSSILTIGPHHSQAADAFNKWSDLQFADIGDKFLTIYDDRMGYRRTDDLARLERLSEVISIRNPQMIEHSLKAA